jgi:phage gp29-like protein
MAILDRLIAAAEGIAARAIAAARPARVTYAQYPAATVSTWTVEQVKTALDNHENGSFSDSARLLDAMGRDERISGCLRSRCNALTSKNGIPFAVEQSEDSSNWIAKRAAKDVARLWWDVIPDSALRTAQRDAVGIGVHVSKINYENVDGMWVPRLQAWDPQNIHWDDTAGKYFASTTTGEVEVTVGDGQWFVYAPDGDRAFMSGAVRCLGLPFLMRGWAYRDWARFCERHGFPILAIREPPIAGAAGEAQRKSFYERLRKLGREGIIRLPQSANTGSPSWGADYIEAKDTNSPAFKDFKAALDVDIAVTLLGQNITTEPGAQQQGVTGAREVKREFCAADAESYSTQAREQIWKPFGRFNYAGWDDSFAPWGRWDCSPPTDKLQRAQTIVAVGDGIKKLSDAGVDVDEKLLADQFGIPQKAVVEQKSVGNLYEYHFKYGIITVNQALARLGLPPREGGDVPVSPVPAGDGASGAPPSGDGAASQDAMPLAPERLAGLLADRLSRGHGHDRVQTSAHERSLATSSSVTGLREGQAYVDAVATDATAQATAAIKPMLAELEREIDESTSPEDLQKRLVAFFKKHDGAALVSTLERAAIMSELAGRAAVLEDI